MRATRLLLSFLLVGIAVLLIPGTAHAWTPGTHVYLGQSVLANLQLLPSHVAALLQAFPNEFLYGNIAADSSIAKKYAPLGRHSHYWHVGQEILDLADSEAVAAFGWGYLCHLAADTVAHNYFVPRQLVLTSSTSSVGHSYWEGRVEIHVGERYSHAARDLIHMDHAREDAHLDRIIAPTIFSVRTNRRLFRGMVRLVDTQGWQRGMQAARDRSRWDLSDTDVELHLSRSLDYMMDLLAQDDAIPRGLDPSGERPLKVAKEIRRDTLREFGRRAPSRLLAAASEHYGLPVTTLRYWPRLGRQLPRAPQERDVAAS